MNSFAPDLQDVARQEILRVLDSLPPEIAEKARTCPVQIEDQASEPEEMDLLGVFLGNSLLEPDPSIPDEIPRIKLFLDVIWEESDYDLEIFEAEVRTTLLHELGHYLGLDEDGVAALGLA